jgi:alpha-tubulin suppressor-like RCC1 family protein
VDPVEVGVPVQQVAVGLNHTCARSTSGTVRCWGSGARGRLGYADPTEEDFGDETPASAGDVPVGGAVVQVSAGLTHSCALLDGGGVRCWGEGAGGRLGYGNTIGSGASTPASSGGDVDLGGPAKQVVAGLDHSYAVREDDEIMYWVRVTSAPRATAMATPSARRGALDRRHRPLSVVS